MTELQQVLQKLSEIESNLTAEISKLDKKTDLGFANINTKFATLEGKFGTELTKLGGKIDTLEGKIETLECKIETKLATLEGKFDTELAKLGGKVENLPERIKLIEASAGKITDIAEKVGEGRGWRQLIQPFFTSLVTLLIGGGINWILGVYRVVK
jgi:predicted  nucleic acid-binding Zn-ribbon protein